MRYVVPKEMLDEARASIEWHTTTGMKVAKPPAMSFVVASWIVRTCTTDATYQREGGGE